MDDQWEYTVRGVGEAWREPDEKSCACGRVTILPDGLTCGDVWGHHEKSKCIMRHQYSDAPLDERDYSCYCKKYVIKADQIVVDRWGKHSYFTRHCTPWKAPPLDWAHIAKLAFGNVEDPGALAEFHKRRYEQYVHQLAAKALNWKVGNAFLWLAGKVPNYPRNSRYDVLIKFYDKLYCWLIRASLFFQKARH